MAEPQQEEWADATATTDESGRSASSGSRPNNQSRILLPPPPLQNSNALRRNAELSNSFIVNLPDLAELELEHSLQNVLNLIPPPPPPHALLRTALSSVGSPAPPPPPPPPPSIAASTSRQVRIAQPASLPQLTEMHSSLMAAIRSAGGAEHAGLRSARTPHASAQVQAPKFSCASDELMRELHKKLNLRRHSVSGRAAGGVFKGACGGGGGGRSGASGGGSGAVRKTNVKKVESCAEAAASHSAHVNPIFSHLSTVMPQSTASTLQFKSASNDNGSDNENENENENEEDWFD